MKIKLFGHQNHRKIYLYICILLPVISITSCKCSKFTINSDEVESIQFWFVHPTELYNHAQLNCADMVFAQDNHDTIIMNREVIKQYIKIINHLKPINQESSYDLRATSLIRMKKKNGRKKANIKACIDPINGKVLLNDTLTKGNKKKIYNFLNEVLYKNLTTYDWLPNNIKGYLKENPEERIKYLPDE